MTVFVEDTPREGHIRSGCDRPDRSTQSSADLHHKSHATAETYFQPFRKRGAERPMDELMVERPSETHREIDQGEIIVRRKLVADRPCRTEVESHFRRPGCRAIGGHVHPQPTNSTNVASSESVIPCFWMHEKR